MMKDKNSFDFLVDTEGILLVLFISEHYFKKLELKILAFYLKSITKFIFMKNWRNIGHIFII